VISDLCCAFLFLSLSFFSSFFLAFFYFSEVLLRRCGDRNPLWHELWVRQQLHQAVCTSCQQAGGTENRAGVVRAVQLAETLGLIAHLSQIR